ncbi:MAG TPA: hypothetical protein VMH87_08770 [Pseudomonadales bacterium]|nr:hypothetical protein [Pseudomonadales bacterium]
MPILIKSGSKTRPLWRECLIGCGLFLIFSVLLFYTARNLEQDYRIYRHGIFTNGTALKGYPIKGGYAVDYKFNYNRLTYQGTTDAKISWVSSAKFPTTIRVHFLASDPNISRVPEVRQYSLPWLEIFFCPFFCVAAFVSGAFTVGELLQTLERRKGDRKGSQPWHLPAYPKAWH